MNEQLITNVKELMNIENNSDLNIIFESLIEQAPIIGKILTSYKIHRLGNRLKEHETKINELASKVNFVDDPAFTELIKNFLFPKILQDLLEEDEDSKVGYFLDGFEQTIDNKINDKSKLLIYYDIIRELRFLEIEYLISLSSQYRRYRHETYYKHKEYPSNPFNSKEFKEIRFVVESKIERLGLVDIGRRMTYKEIMKRMDSELQRAQRYLASSGFEDRIELTAFGYKFLNFFYLLEKYKL